MIIPIIIFSKIYQKNKRRNKMEEICILFWIILILMNTMIASEKNRSGLAVFISSIFLSPLVPYLYLLAVPALPITQKTDNKKGNVD